MGIFDESRYPFMQTIGNPASMYPDNIHRNVVFFRRVKIRLRLCKCALRSLEQPLPDMFAARAALVEAPFDAGCAIGSLVHIR
jgi:hypothetical protein